MTDKETLVPELDHVVIMVHGDLDASVERYAAMGFDLTPRGHHSLGSSNNLAIFQNNYLELLGFEEGKKLLRPELMETPRGLAAVVWRCPDLDAVVSRLDETGLKIEDPTHFVRPVETGEGTFDAAFAVINFPKKGFAEGRSFFCHHKTPEYVWREEWQSHPNTAVDVSEYVFAGGAPEETLAMFDTFFGPGVMKPVDGGMAIEAGAGQVVALTAEAGKARFGDAVSIIPEEGEARMIALGVRCKSLDAARKALTDGGVPFEDLGARLRAGEDAAFGLAIEFHE
ncbi:MAG: hypothetical protein MnENMB40S_10180 [Rhizobiaceae bacterium MnEN-MB40S]|nr:MAG: hypothetical protein MnENMB40S_10180 [Rhizobiaceae bacterium MnEN-MB40S]